VRYINKLEIKEGHQEELVDIVVDKYKDIYPNLEKNRKKIKEELLKEGEKFRETLKNGLKVLGKEMKASIHKLGSRVDIQDLSSVDGFPGFVPVNVDGAWIFDFYQKFGFPFELVVEELEAKEGYKFHEKQIEELKNGFNKELKKHQELSRKGAEQKFKGGLADNSDKTTMLHTSTHLMLAGLRKVLGGHVHQAGSNITQERTRFDFTHPEKVSREDLDEVEEYVNEAISKNCPVIMERIEKTAAQVRGVEGSFWEKYPDEVDVYTVKCDDGTVYSQELCGGPHVKNTGDIKGTFHIKKEKASSAGVRRIKAVLE